MGLELGAESWYQLPLTSVNGQEMPRFFIRNSFDLYSFKWLTYSCLQKNVISIPIHFAQGRFREESLNNTAVFFEKCNILSYSVLQKDVISSFQPPPQIAVATMRE